MASATFKEKGCIFQWKIENVSQWWWLKEGEGIESPTFIAEGLKGTKWSLRLYPKGDGEENNIGFYLHRAKECDGPDEIEVSFQLAILKKDSSIFKLVDFTNRYKKNTSWGRASFESQESVFVNEKEEIIHEDTLTVQCTVITEPCLSNHVFSRTVINVKRISFVWKINKNSALKSEIRNKFEHYLFCSDAISNENLDKLCVELSSFNDDVNYISCSISILDSEGRKEIYGTNKYHLKDLQVGTISFTLPISKSLMENKSKYFPNDVLSLDFYFVVSTVEHFDFKNISCKLENEVAVKEKCRNTTNLSDDLKSMYNGGIFSDVEIRTSTKSFPAHKCPLSSRSPVFNSMFSSDMKEKNNGHVFIDDFEDDIIHRMLIYLYTDSLEDLQFESACKLYEIADKYLILSLKYNCSSFLEDNLCPSNACDALILADRHNDDDFKIYIQNYILEQYKKVFYLQEWKDFMNRNLKSHNNDLEFCKNLPVKPGKVKELDFRN